MTKQEIQNSINELQKQLDKCPEIEPFTCKGEWTTRPEGLANITETFNYWQTKEIAEKAYQLQLRHRKMLSFVSQHQELGVGDWYIFSDVASEWDMSEVINHYPDTVMMTKETADLMLEAIKNGSLNLEKIT